jgi:hypothetical protein
MKIRHATALFLAVLGVGCSRFPGMSGKELPRVPQETRRASPVFAQGMKLLRNKDFHGLQAFLDAKEAALFKEKEPSSSKLADVWLLRGLSYMDEQNPLGDMDKAYAYIRIAQSDPGVIGGIAEVLLGRLQALSRQEILLVELNKKLDKAGMREAKALEELSKCKGRIRRLQSELEALRRLDEKQRSLRESGP